MCSSGSPDLPVWIIAVLRLFWRNVVPQAGRAIDYNQKKAAKLRTITVDSTEGQALASVPRTRSVAVLDVWDAMRSDRPYRTGRPDEQVRKHIRALVGTHFDQRVVHVFLDLERSAHLRSNTRRCAGLSGKG